MSVYVRKNTQDLGGMVMVGNRVLNCVRGLRSESSSPPQAIGPHNCNIEYSLPIPSIYLPPYNLPSLIPFVL